ncbi:MAG: metallophosphoesterase [Pseudomonadota bacterium]
MLIQNFARNLKGRDFAVGDIHGYFSLLQQALADVNFDTEIDRLFSVGDLIDRGPECTRVLAFLAQPWFFAVRGNHEDYVCRYQTVDEANWLKNGGSWFMELPSDDQAILCSRLKELPFCIQVETALGPVGIVHADIPFSDWNKTRENLDSRRVQDFCMWSRRRLQTLDTRHVDGARAVVVGHNALKKVLVLGNVYHIDTTAWKPDEGGYFTLLNLETLEAYPQIEVGTSGKLSEALMAAEHIREKGC